ncbi:MAG: cation-translocating P-type ATPase [Selenomonas ruminantium]|nr:cation-translocating P-type ATPase [Selenomonas ruminantium]
MLSRLNEILSGMKMTLAGGLFLFFSLLAGWQEYPLPADPAWVTVVICGLPLLYLALSRLVCNSGIKKISSALLISIAMCAAIAIGDLFAAGEVAFIMALGAIIEEKTTQRAQKGLKKLLSLAPETGRRLREGKEEIVLAQEISAGDLLRILPGEKIPADGEIIKGSTSVDQSVLTGESLPVDKVVGEKVLCGTINCFGAIDIRVTKAGEDSSLHKLIRMVQEAEAKKAPMERIADRWASWLVPVALSIAIAAYFLTGDVVRAVTVLVVFCPCALVLATPTAIMAAIGQATKHGVIVKSGEALESMGKADLIAFDKTGTLTYGRLSVTDVIPLSDCLDKNRLLTLAASAESHSEHPLAKALCQYAQQQGIALEAIDYFQMQTGKGIRAQVKGELVFCGNEAFLQEKGIALTAREKSELLRLSQQGKAIILVAVRDTLCGVVAFSDVLRPEAKAVLEELRQMNTGAVLLTGDTAQAASYFAQLAGITEVKSNLLPEEKVGNIERLERAQHTVCMIGDGVNDAPSLKAASIGVAMADMGSDIAVEAADIALMKEDLSQLPYLKRLANATIKTIKISIAMSLGINFIAILMSIQGLLTPTTGALVHNAGSCLVVLFAALLYDRNFASSRTNEQTSQPMPNVL